MMLVVHRYQNSIRYVTETCLQAMAIFSRLCSGPRKPVPKLSTPTGKIAFLIYFAVEFALRNVSHK